MKLTIKEIYSLFEKEYSGKDFEINGISTDSRSLKSGEVFVAIKGENTDGHKYVKDAAEKGACLLIVQKDVKAEMQVMRVKNTRSALLALAGYYLDKFNKVKVAAVTGSNGKTSTKEILAALLGIKYTTVKSEKSYNNYIGMPSTIFRLTDGTQALVLELGMNHKGEIKSLAGAINIDTAVITNIGRSHIGFFRRLEDIALAKAEIKAGLKKDGVIILNADDKLFGVLKGKFKNRKILTFGFGDASDIKVGKVEALKTGTAFTVTINEKNYPMSTKLRGVHNIYNIAAAIAAANSLGVSVMDIKTVLKKFTMAGLMRFEEKQIKRLGVTIINDCYNANPDSFKAAVDTLKMYKYRPLIVVTGDMLELGEKSAEYHREIGQSIAELPVKKAMILGKYAKYVEQGILMKKRSIYGNKIKKYTDKNKLAKDLKAIIKKGDTVFIKGSRANKLEEIVDKIKKR